MLLAVMATFLPCQREMPDCYASKNYRWEECPQMSVKMARSNPSTAIRVAR